MPITRSYIILSVALVALSLFFVAWKNDKKQLPLTAKEYKDTVPKNREKKVRDLDEVLEELNNVDLKKEMENAQLQMEKAMKQLDAAKIQAEIAKSIKEIDVEKIKAELDKSLSKIDLEKMKAELSAQLKEIDTQKIKKEVEASLAKIDMEKMNEDMQKMKLDLEKMKPNLEKELEKAKKDIEKAKVEIKEYKSFVDGLDKDGLIDKKKEYKIEIKNGELFINDQQQPASVTNKYKSFIEKHKTFTITKTADDFKISNDDKDDDDKED